MESAEEEDNNNIYMHLIRFLIRSDELIIQIMAEICHPLRRRSQFSLQ